MKRSTTVASASHRSGYELLVMMNLERSGIRYQYEPHTFKILMPGKGRCADCDSKKVVVPSRYTVDLYLPDFDIWVELKGKFTARDRKRFKALHDQHPDHDLRLLFQANNWITKTHANRYTDWCEGLDIRCAVGNTVPTEWVTTKRRARKRK